MDIEDSKVTGMAGIKADGIKDLCLNIQNYNENIKKALTRISDLVDDSSTYYSSESRSSVVQKCNSFKLSYDVIFENISTYIDDYNSAVSKFEEIDSSIAVTDGLKENES